MVRNKPLITICIPTHNRAEYLPETIRSILNQTYKNFELFVINDASTDDTEAVVKDFKDRRMTYIKNRKNLGYIASMNKGTRLSKCEWIMHVSDDDRMRPTMLDEMTKVLGEQENKTIGFIVPQSANINGKGDLISDPSLQLNRKKYIVLNPGEFIFNFTLYGKKVLGKYIFNTSFPSTLFNRKILIELGLSSKAVPVSHDILIESKICLMYPVIVIDKPLFEYRVHQNLGSSLNKRGTFLEEYQKFLLLLFAFIDKKKITFPYDFKTYANNALISYLFSLNGGLVRLAARFDGGYSKRIFLIKDIVRFGLKQKKQLLINPRFYIVLLFSLLPRFVLLQAGKHVGSI